MDVYRKYEINSINILWSDCWIFSVHVVIWTDDGLWCQLFGSWTWVCIGAKLWLISEKIRRNTREQIVFHGFGFGPFFIKNSFWIILRHNCFIENYFGAQDSRNSYAVIWRTIKCEISSKCCPAQLLVEGKRNKRNARAWIYILHMSWILNYAFHKHNSCVLFV